MYRKPVRFREVPETVSLFEGHYRGYGGECVEPALHAHRDVLEVVWRAAEDCNGIQVFGTPEHLFQGVVYRVTPILRL